MPDRSRAFPLGASPVGHVKVFVIAGEASGDKLGGALMAGLSSMQDVQYEGVGGPMMEAQGLTSLFDMEELSVMGLIEILPRYFDLKRRITETAQAVLRSKPDLLIGIDSPDFCLRVAKIVKAQSRTRVVHYVAPSVWAWRPGRAQKMVGVVDQVLALLPFEPPYLEDVGIECDFVGHPVAAEPLATPDEMTALREELGFGAAPVLLVLPGSRKSEVDRMAPIYGAALRSICAARPDLRVLVPTIGPRVAQVREAVKDWAGAPVLLAPQGEDAGINGARK
ncbi:MAG: lipid-A-disaccharide synthase, partial [Pseudomonadota bacterium]